MEDVPCSVDLRAPVQAGDWFNTLVWHSKHKAAGQNAEGQVKGLFSLGACRSIIRPRSKPAAHRRKSTVDFVMNKDQFTPINR